MTNAAISAPADPLSDPRIDPQIRAFLNGIEQGPDAFLGIPTAETTKSF